MPKLADRLNWLETLRPDPETGIKHIIIRSIIRPGSDEPVSAFAYLLGHTGPSKKIQMSDGETYEKFKARITALEDRQ